jgi:hypothetical protein
MTAEAFHNSSHPELHRLDIMDRLSNTPNVLATYKQYKHDTEYIAGWLAETTRSLG